MDSFQTGFGLKSIGSFINAFAGHHVELLSWAEDKLHENIFYWVAL